MLCGHKLLMLGVKYLHVKW